MIETFTKVGAAHLLGISRQALDKRLKTYPLPYDAAHNGSGAWSRQTLIDWDQTIPQAGRPPAIPHQRAKGH